MKKLLFLLAILLASLPLRAAEEEIYLKFTGATASTKVYNRIGDGEELTEYSGIVNGKFAPTIAGTMKDYTLPLTDKSLQGNVGTVKYFKIKKGTQVIYSITFSDNLYTNAGGSYAFGTNLRLAIYGFNYPTLNREFAITSSNPAEYPIKQVVFGDAYDNRTETAFTEAQLNAIDVTNNVEGTWSFNNGSLIFTPNTPQSEIKFKVNENAKTAYTTMLRIGHLGIVRAVKAAAPKLKADGATSFPMVVGDEFLYIGSSADVEIATEPGVDYVYDTMGEPNAASTTVENGKIRVNGSAVGATTDLYIAAKESDGSIGNVRHIVCRRVAVPAVTLPEDTPGYADGVFSYQVAQGKIKIERPAGVDKVFFTLDGYEPNTPQAHELPADGIITLPTAAVGHTTQLKLVAQCGTEYGAVTTIPCTRVPMSKPVVFGYTINFTTRNQGYDTYLDGYDESSLITDLANGVVINENHLLLRLQSPFSYDSESDGPFLEAQMSDSPTADHNGNWITILTPMVDHPECVVFEQGENDFTSINFGLLDAADHYFLNDSRNQCYLHLRASNLAKNIDSYPEGKDLVTSEAITLHVMKAKPAAPAKPVVTMWTEQTGYNHNDKSVTTQMMQPLTEGRPLDIAGNELLLAFGSHYDANDEPKIQYQLSDSPEADPDGDWTIRTTWVKTNDTYNGNDLLLLQKDNSINIKDMLFPATDGKRPTEIYLHLRAVTTNNTQSYDFVASEATTLRLTHSRPEAPSIKLLTPGSTKGSVTRFVNSAKACPEYYGLTATRKIQYAFAEATNPLTWPGTEPEAWTDYDGNTASTIETDGRMYARIYDSEYDQASDITVMDFELIKADRIKAEGWQGVDNNSLVQLDEPMKVMGCYMTRSAGSSRTAYVYLVDSDGNPLKMVISGDETALKQSLTDLGYFDFANGAQHQGQDLVVNAGNIIARVSKTVTDDNLGLMPEILVTPTAGESYIDYLGGATWQAFTKSDAYMTAQESMVKDGNEWIEQPRTTIDVKNDFGRKVSLRSLEWLGGNRVRTADGMELTLYNRLDVSETGYKFDEDIQNLVAGRLYKVTGYVGQLNGNIALFPISATMQCPGTPTLYAPNLIDGEKENGFIKVNAISQEVTFTIASDTDEKAEFFYKKAASPDALQTAQLTAAADGEFTLPLEEEATCYLAVYAKLNDMLSLRPAMVAITRHQAQSVGSIAEFKTLEAERRAEAGYDGSEKLYRLNGKAVIRMTTTYYLYVSDIADANTPTEPAKQYLLIYNENGWTNPQITDGDKTRSLQAGDVIENFALVGRDGMKLRGNIISNSTDFARTYKYAGQKMDPADFSPSTVEVNYVDASSDSHYSKVALGEDQRMTYIELHNVKVKRSGTDESDYAYTLDIAGEPSLTFDVFPRTQGWHTMWKADEGFTITGVVVRDDAADGTEGYAFAPTVFKAANNLEGVLGVKFEGQGEVRDNVQYFVQGKAVIEYTPAAGETPDIYYTLDGTDPRDNVAGRIHVKGTRAEIELTSDVVVRAFAASPGLNPSAETSRSFKNAVNEVQYILNFLRAGVTGNTYRFTSKLQIVSSGDKYLFVAGPVGHFLPVYKADGWDESLYPAGSYVQHLLAVKSTDSNGNIMADASLYDTPEAIDPSEIEEVDKITVTPDEVSVLTAASARRYVTVSNVTAKAAAARAAGMAPFTITTVDGSQSHPLMDGNLGKVTIKEVNASGDLVDTQLGFADGEAYDITGFVMLGEAADGSDEAGVELWPVSAIHLVRTPAVSVSLQDALPVIRTDENEYLGRFKDVAAVSISAGNVRDARIYYSFDNEEWFEYFKPIAVEGSCMIHAKAQAPGMAESVHTHLTLEKVTVSGDIEFATTPAPEGGKVSVSLSPADHNIAEGAYKIYYTTDGTNPTTASALYSDSFELTESRTVKAILVEDGCEPGAVCTAYISVATAPTTTPEDPDPTVSGRVKFTLDDSDPSKVLVKIEPDGEAAPGYKIYYTTEAGKTLPEDGIEYKDPFEVTESSIVMAVLVENGKLSGPVAEVSVWVNPGVTGIDGIPTDEAEGGVRVDGNSIVAPEGSRIFDISGRQTGRRDDLRRGVYIVVTPDGKSVKVLVK